MFFNLFENDFFLIIPEFFLFFYIIYYILYFLVDLNLRFLNVIISLSLLVNVILFFLMFNVFTFDFFCFNWMYFSSFNIYLVKILSNSLITLLILSFFDYLKFERYDFLEYLFFVFICLFSIFFILGSNDFIFLYLFLELLGLSSYILSASKKYSNFSSESGLKYFVLSSFSSVFILKGSSFIYGIYGTTNFKELFDLSFFLDYSYNYLFLFSLFFIFIGLLFKIAVVPFHSWAPDVYEGSPTAVVLFFSTVPKISFLFLLYRLTFEIFINYVEFYSSILIISALLSIILGAFSSFYQTNLKRLLAYSSISHSGFILICFVPLTHIGVFAFYVYLFIYFVLVVNFFIFLLHIRFQFFYLEISNLNFLVFFFKMNSLISFAFGILMFSFAGLPPLAGFFSKLFVFYSVLELNNYLIFIFFIFLVTFSSIYYIRLVVFIFFNNFNNKFILFFMQLKENFFYLLFNFLYFNLFFVFFQDWVFYLIHIFFINSYFFI